MDEPDEDKLDEKGDAGPEQPLVRLGLRLANWSERWFPDPLIFALVGIVVVFIAGLLLRQSPAELAIQGGKNFWTLVPFTMQMVMIIVGGYVVASTPIVYRAIRGLAGIPKSPRAAIAMVALFSMLTSLISWGLSLIFSGLFVRELAHRVKGMDYRAAGAAAYLGLGAVWAMGLSSSAAMLMVAAAQAGCRRGDRSADQAQRAVRVDYGDVRKELGPLTVHAAAHPSG